MSTATPPLTVDDVRQRVGERSFQRAQDYVGTAFHDTRRQGQTLRAWCEGTAIEPYAVQATLGRDGIDSAQCSCPVGDGGYCKHVAAMLLTWLGTPDAFRPVEALEFYLQKRSKKELVRLIQEMVDRYPELESLVELSAAVDAAAERPLDPEAVRRQVRQAFASARGNWRDGRNVASALGALIAMGQQQEALGQWQAAATVYLTTAEESLAQFETIHDEEGDVLSVVNECVTGLGRCLPAVDEDPVRGEMLRALLDIYLWDVAYGGVGVGDEVPDLILEQARPEEGRRVAARLRDSLPAGDALSDNYRRQVLGGFLLALEQDQLDDEAYLRLCRETGRLGDLVTRLLALGRVEEAVVATEAANDYALLGLVNRFGEAGQAEVAWRLVRKRADSSQDWRLKEWLKDQALARSDLDEALRWAEALLWQQPSLPSFQSLQTIAQAGGQWEALRPALLERLAKEQRYHLLVQIHVETKELDAAFQAYEHLLRRHRYSGLGPLLAEAAEAERPRDAVRLYMAEVEALIERRGRDNYAMAARYLQRVRALYARLGDDEAWQTLIADLRQGNSRLRALQEELNTAGL
jgi:uncharacterized Zn finger protein